MFSPQMVSCLLLELLGLIHSETNHSILPLPAFVIIFLSKQCVDNIYLASYRVCNISKIFTICKLFSFCSKTINRPSISQQELLPHSLPETNEALDTQYQLADDVFTCFLSPFLFHLYSQHLEIGQCQNPANCNDHQPECFL